jgi:CHAD domain-containing protein
VDELKQLFSALGKTRDSDVLAGGVAAELAKVGAPPLAMRKGDAGPDPATLIRAADTQKMLLAWLAWRVELAEAAAAAAAMPVAAVAGAAAREAPQVDATLTADGAPAAADEAASVVMVDPVGEPGAVDGSDQQSLGATASEAVARVDLEPAHEDGKSFQREARRRLGKWHRRIVAAWKAFDGLQEEDLHALRKHIKRQRYAVEFFAPVLRRRDVERYLKSLASIQDRMGELNDLFVARDRYQALVSSDPAAWFALGWLAARIAEARMMAKPALKRIAKADPPGR